MKRRINFLLKGAEGIKLLRRRTIKKCIAEIEKRGIQLTERIDELRKNPDLLQTIISIYVEMVIQREYYKGNDKEILIGEIINSRKSSTEIEMILELLRLLGLTPSHVMTVLGGSNQKKILQTDDQKLYELIQYASKERPIKKT